MSDVASPTPVPSLAKSDLNLVWLDCEMSGLDPERERLLEIAVIVTGPDLTPRIEGPVLVIHQSDELLGKMDAWNKGTHNKYMPKLEAWFHYRNLDVSTLKELSRRWKPEVFNAFKKAQKHTALADVHESIDELMHYREHFLKL